MPPVPASVVPARDLERLAFKGPLGPSDEGYGGDVNARHGSLRTLDSGADFLYPDNVFYRAGSDRRLQPEAWMIDGRRPVPTAA